MKNKKLRFSNWIRKKNERMFSLEIGKKSIQRTLQSEIEKELVEKCIRKERKLENVDKNMEFDGLCGFLKNNLFSLQLYGRILVYNSIFSSSCLNSVNDMILLIAALFIKSISMNGLLFFFFLIGIANFRIPFLSIFLVNFNFIEFQICLFVFAFGSIIFFSNMLYCQPSINIF
jgi:hypothetical protein